MAVYEINRNIKAHTDVIWNVLSNHDAFTEIAPDIIKVETVSGEKVGMIRRLHHKSGKVWEEKCTAWEDNHYYTMEVDTTSYPLPVKKMTRTCSMKEGQKNTKVTISYKYKPKYRFFGNFMDKHQILPILKLYSNQLMENIARKIYDSEWQYHITVETILKDKGNEFIYVNPETLIGEANKIRHDNRIGSLLVLNENKQIEGILSERDIVNILAETGPEILDQPVSSIMTRNVSVCSPKDDLEKIMTLMTEKRIRHMPVVENDIVVGLISLGDAVKMRMEELESESEAMHEYIDSRRWREVSIQLGPKTASEEYA